MYSLETYQVWFLKEGLLDELRYDIGKVPNSRDS